MSVPGSAAQLTATSGRCARALRRWIARATSSLPVPVSPVRRTAAPVGATCSTRWRTRFSAGLRPTISSKPSAVVQALAEDDVLGLGAVLEVRDLGEARAQPALRPGADDRAREDLAEQPEARQERRRPVALRRHGRDREKPDRPLPDPQRKHEVRPDPVRGHELPLLGPGFRDVIQPPHRETEPLAGKAGPVGKELRRSFSEGRDGVGGEDSDDVRSPVVLEEHDASAVGSEEGDEALDRPIQLRLERVLGREEVRGDLRERRLEAVLGREPVSVHHVDIYQQW